VSRWWRRPLLCCRSASASDDLRLTHGCHVKPPGPSATWRRAISKHMWLIKISERVAGVMVTRAVTRYGPRPLTDRFPSEHDQAHSLQGGEISLSPSTTIRSAS
jgi:hypothetical protein